MLSYKLDEKAELRLAEDRYAEEFHSVVTENLPYLEKWLSNFNADFDLDKARTMLNLSLQGYWYKFNYDLLIFEQDKIVGRAMLFSIDSINKRADIHYWVAQSAQGKGLVTRSCRYLANYAFNVLELNRLVINCAVDNLPSRAVAERLGFQFEGIMRQVEWVNGRFVDWAGYSMLREDWAKISENL